MTKANITQYSATPSENTDIDDINIDEGCPASGLNNALRSLLSHLKNVDTGSQALTALSVAGSVTATTSLKTPLIEFTDGDNALTIADGGNVTANANLTVSGDLIASSLNGGQFGGRRNIVINGSAQCWQRATSSSSTGYTSADRWSYYAPSSLAISRSTDVPTGFQYAISVGGGGDSSGITQKIEASTCKQLVGKTVTVSFYLKQTTGSGTDKIAVALSRANSEDSFGGTTSISTQTISTTTSYARYTCTFTSLPAEVANGLQITIKSNGAGSVVYLITGVQCEVGQVTNFEHRSFGEELALCQRYFQSVTYENGGAVSVGLAYSSGTSAIAPMDYKGAKMRVAPTITMPSAGQSNGNVSFLATSTGFPSTIGSHTATNISVSHYSLRGASYSGLGNNGDTSWLYSVGGVVFKYDSEL